MYTIRRFGWQLLATCFLSGCGLGDYESHIDKQRARLRMVDEENKYLGQMLENPPPQADDDPRPLPFDIFMRLPRGISATVADKEGSFPINKDLLIYRYPGARGYNVFLAAMMIARDQPNEPSVSDAAPQAFQESFRSAVTTILGKNWPRPEKLEHLVRPPINYSADKPVNLTFEYFKLEDDGAVKDAADVGFYFHQKGSRLIGLAFQTPLAQKNDSAVQQGIDLCVRSLDISDRATIKRKNFATFKRWD